MTAAAKAGMERATSAYRAGLTLLIAAACYEAVARSGVFKIEFQAPAISGQPGSTTVSSGQPATFTVGAAGTGALSYQWQELFFLLTCASVASSL